MKYDILVKILDQLRSEAPQKLYKKYRNGETNIDEINQGRARAYIHLFLKVSFGLFEFNERERYITDGSYDGGIDGYFIDKECKIVYFLQSKFRTNPHNFEEKEISYDELLCMDVDRITAGEIHDEAGNEYSGKIKQLQRDISDIPDIARYTYRIIVIANTKNVSQTNLRKLCAGFPVEVFDSKKCYEKLVFPIITGTYFNATDLSINIDLSNKNAGSKIGYTVQTGLGECDITVLFVPTIELAKIMHKYKNSILKYNPRSYLKHDGHSIHMAIRDTLINKCTNEFAIFNNGITMLSDETDINEKVGQKNKAQMRVKNPQILNGGQTCYTLSKILSELSPDKIDDVFKEKEVLLKVITLRDSTDESKKIDLIEAISNATNRQTPVINADKYSNESIHVKLQKILFERYGILYERKRGEFEDGLNSKYISNNQIRERNLLLRIYYASNGNIQVGIQKKLFQNQKIPNDITENITALDNMFIGLKIFDKIWDQKSPLKKATPAEYGKVYFYTKALSELGVEITDELIDEKLPDLEQIWKAFILFTKGKARTKKIKRRDPVTGDIVEVTKTIRYHFTNIAKDLEEFFESRKNA